jgi:imidazolonepropionase-like amidohydrolase
MRRTFLMALLLPCVLLSLAVVHAEEADKGPIVIRAGHLLDVTSGKLEADQSILIEDGVIKEVGSKVAAPAGAVIIDLSRAVVLPGLIDCHTHITAQPSNYYEDLFRKSPIDHAVTAHIYTRRTLEAGFTTCRDLGSVEFIDVALRNAINRGDVVGPRLLVAGLYIGSTGGHGDISGFSPYIEFHNLSGVADGIDEIRKKIRFNVKNGVDLIKIGATAGVLSEEESVGAPQYSFDELQVAVEEAHMWGKRVAAHAHGTEGIKLAIRAGVDSVEHASLIDDEGIRMALERGTYLVMDVYNDDYIVSEYTRLGYPEKIIEKERRIGRQQRENFRRAVEAGVKIAYGTDAGVYPHGGNAKQFVKMVEWGQTPLQAIQSATIVAAELLDIEELTGSLSSGKSADIVAVPGNPLEDISVMEKVFFVMKEGVVYKHATPMEKPTDN